ncbi:putative Coatomer subunit delta [Paratrimastix pyriformis]|uniref:Coatomer subunit delta n=1 Tax=Paratrimastix pyriformis TaxID=342808 RepID=A0ABQ8UPJ9_9EUKA|nr:putative Coatomer subunit delta [Paratrimastix pyriformis]
MGVIGAGILTRVGRVLVSTCFERTSHNIDNLFAAFTKLLPSGNREHQMLETESAYYLYQPLEQLYLVMIATKTSNMVENLDCLHLLARIVLTAVPLPDEASIRDSMFDIKFKWDEAVTFGFPNHLTLDEITQNVQMYSYEEELSRKLLDEKRQAARRHIKAELTKAEEARRRAAGGQGSSILGFGETPALPAGHVGSMTAPFGTPAGDVDAGHPSSSTPIVSTPMGGASPSMNPAPSAPRPSGRKGGIKLSSRVALKPDAVESLKQDMGVSPAPRPPRLPSRPRLHP